MCSMKTYGLLILVSFSLLLSGCLDNGGNNTTTASEQLKKDLQSIDAFLTAEGITAIKDPRGFRYVIDSVGGGFTPRTENKIKVKYVGRLLNKSIFDQDVSNLVLSSYIPGFQMGMGLLPEGTKARLYIPSIYAYGANGTTGIPGNSNLIFEVFLTDVETTTDELDQLAADTVAIDQYLKSNSINAVKDPSGLRYIITLQGSGAKPHAFSQVKMNYTGKILATGNTFYTGTAEPTSDFDSRVVNFLHGFQAGLPKLPKGSKATFYMPSGLGYGANPPSGASIPRNTNIIFEVELTDVLN